MLIGAEQLRYSVEKLAVTLLLCAEQLHCSVVKIAVKLLLGSELLLLDCCSCHIVLLVANLKNGASCNTVAVVIPCSM